MYTLIVGEFMAEQGQYHYSHESWSFMGSQSTATKALSQSSALKIVMKHVVQSAF